MDKLNKITNAVFVVFIILVIYIFYFYYTKKKDEDVDMNGDGIVTKVELQEYVKKEMERRSKSPPQFSSILKSSISGAIRGALMGLIINGIEGAITSAIVFGTINPILTGIEHTY